MSLRSVLNMLAGGILAATVVVRVAAASPYSTIYAFGDSLSDAGNIYVGTGGALPLPPYSDGRFTNGPVWVQDLSQALGLGPVTPSLLGGNDFAFGGAETGTTLGHTATTIDLPSQLSMFETAVPTPQPNALYTLWIGSEDVFDILGSTLSPALKAMAGMQAIQNIDTFVTGIALHGAHNLLVLTVPDLGKTPRITSMGPGPSQAASLFTLQFDQTLLASLVPIQQAFDLNLRTVDTFSLLDEAIDDPAQFGFTNVTDPCWTGNYFGQNGTLCAPTMAAQDQYLFWDQLHPTARGHALIADAALNAIPEPPGWMVLAAGFCLIGMLRSWGHPLGANARTDSSADSPASALRLFLDARQVSYKSCPKPGCRTGDLSISDTSPQREMLDNRTERERRKESQPTHDHDRAEQQSDKLHAVRGQRPGRYRHDPFGREQSSCCPAI